MNTLVIGLGQAGTTIAANITANLYERNVKFINPNGTSCKTFLIDSEAKVISNFLSKNVELSKYFSKYEYNNKFIRKRKQLGFGT